ncbi:hypothetical protein [Sphingomonas oligophenolica]
MTMRLGSSGCRNEPALSLVEGSGTTLVRIDSTISGIVGRVRRTELRNGSISLFHIVERQVRGCQRQQPRCYPAVPPLFPAVIVRCSSAVPPLLFDNSEIIGKELITDEKIAAKIQHNSGEKRTSPKTAGTAENAGRAVSSEEPAARPRAPLHQ